MCNNQKNKTIKLIVKTIVLMSFSATTYGMKPYKKSTAKPIIEKKVIPDWRKSKKIEIKSIPPQLLSKINAAPEEITPPAENSSLFLKRSQDLDDIREENDLDMLAQSKSLAESLELSYLQISMMGKIALSEHLAKYMDSCQKMLNILLQNRGNNHIYFGQIKKSFLYIRKSFVRLEPFNQQALAELNKKYNLLMESYLSLK